MQVQVQVPELGQGGQVLAAEPTITCNNLHMCQNSAGAVALHTGPTETHHNEMMKGSKYAENSLDSNGIFRVFIEKELGKIW
jgi:hypothetical protein